MANEEKVDANSSAAADSNPSPVVISDGAALALGNALSRFITPSTTTSSKRASKRPRKSHSPVVLAQDEQVRKQVDDEREQKKRYKELRKRKLAFESNARVIPDAATGAALEKELMATATRGAVALFNAVSRAQRTTAREMKMAMKDRKKLNGGKGSAVTKENFMNLMKAGIDKASVQSSIPMSMDKLKKQETKNDDETKDEKEEEESEMEEDEDDDASEDEDENKEQSAVASVRPGSKPKWLKADFITSGAKRLRDWDKDEDDEAEQSSDDDDSDENDGDGDDSEMEEDMSDIDEDISSAEDDDDDDESA